MKFLFKTLLLFLFIFGLYVANAKLGDGFIMIDDKVLVAGEMLTIEEFKALDWWSEGWLYFKKFNSDIFRLVELAKETETSISSQKNEEVDDDIISTVVIVVAVLLILGAVSGLKKGMLGDVALYEDYKDVVSCFSISILPFVALVIYAVGGEAYVISGFIMIIFGVLWAQIVLNSMISNKSVITGFSVGTAKIVFSFLFILNIINIYVTLKSPNKTFTERRTNLIVSGGILGLMTPILNNLIKGNQKKEDSPRKFVDKLSKISRFRNSFRKYF